MYKLRKTVMAKSDITKPVSVSTEAKYSAKDVYDLLSSLNELKEKKIVATENNGTYEFAVDDIVYIIEPDLI